MSVRGFAFVFVCSLLTTKISSSHSLLPVCLIVLFLPTLSLSNSLAYVCASAQLLAVGGHQQQGATDVGQLCIVQFYTPLGEHIRGLRVPGTALAGLAWDGGGARMALAADGAALFASVRRQHLWGHMADGTLVYAHASSIRPEHRVVFWGPRRNESHTQHVARLTHLTTKGDLCLLVSKVSVRKAAAILEHAHSPLSCMCLSNFRDILHVLRRENEPLSTP